MLLCKILTFIHAHMYMYMYVYEYVSNKAKVRITDEYMHRYMCIF